TGRTDDPLAPLQRGWIKAGDCLAARRCQYVDQAVPVGTAPTGHQIVAGYCRIPVAAAGDVVEIGVVARAHADIVDSGVDEPDIPIAVGSRLLIGQSQVAGPHGRGKAGSAVFIGRAAGLVGANVKGKIRVGRHVGGVPIGRGPFVFRVNYTR